MTGLFDKDFYLKQNPDVARSQMGAFDHYMLYGAEEGRDPSEHFSTAWYLQRNPDVRSAGINPLIHYIMHGRFEGRQPKPSSVMVLLLSNARSLLGEDAEGGGSSTLRLTTKDFLANDECLVEDNRIIGATGNDPQLLSDEPLPAGFYRLTATCTPSGVHSAMERDLFFEMHLDLGRGFQSESAYRFPISGSAFTLNFIFFCEAEAKALRIDPINSYCNLRMEVEITGVAPSAALRELYLLYMSNSADTVRSKDKFLEQINPENISRFLWSLSGCVDLRRDDYERWCAVRALDGKAIDAMRHRIGNLLVRPHFSIVMPTYKSDLTFLGRAIESVRAQVYPFWTLYIVDDGSGEEDLCRFIESCAAYDDRIVFEALDANVGISAASNHALAMAQGDFIALLDHDDELAPHALYAMAEAIEANPKADMLYSDEDKIDVNGVRSGPFFKPDWSPEFMLSCMYTCHLSVYRRTCVEEVGRFRSQYDYAQDFDLCLRITRVAREIVHVRDILYHWRTLPTSTAAGATAKPTAELAARRALQSHVDALGFRGKALPGELPGMHRVKLEMLGEPLVSIVIPTAARRIAGGAGGWYLLDLLISIAEKSSYRNLEIVLVENGDFEDDLEDALLRTLSLHPLNIRRVLYREPLFNIAQKMNLGVAEARGEYVILLNDDMRVITPDWVEELVSWLQRPGIVASGAKLLFPDDTVQHAGVLFLAQGPSHVYYGAADSDAGLVGSAISTRNYSAVSGACLAVTRQNYLAVGGFDEAFRINYNDVDFCLKLLALGRIVYTPFSKLYHYESVSKDIASVHELSAFNMKWESIVGVDPQYNLHLSQFDPNRIGWNPRELIDRV